MISSSGLLLLGGIFSPIALLLLYRILLVFKPVWRTRLLLVVLTAAQFFQYWLAIEVIISVFGLSVSPGSCVIFPLNLVIVLLAFLKRSVYEFVRFALLIIGVNLFIAALAASPYCSSDWLQTVSEAIPPSLITANGIALILSGTLLTLADFVVMALVLGLLVQRGVQFLPRVVLPLLVALTVDAVGYSFLLNVFQGHPLAETLVAHVLSKSITAVWYSLILSIYIYSIEPHALADSKEGPSGLKLFVYLLGLRQSALFERVGIEQSKLIPKGPPQLVEKDPGFVMGQVRDLIAEICQKRMGSVGFVLIRPDDPNLPDDWQPAFVKVVVRRTGGPYNGWITRLDPARILVVVPDGENRVAGLIEQLEHFWSHDLGHPLRYLPNGSLNLVKHYAFDCEESGRVCPDRVQDPSAEIVRILEGFFVTDAHTPELQTGPASLYRGMLLLAPEQWHEIETAPNQVCETTNPQTGVDFVVLRKEEYKRLSQNDPATLSSLPPGLVEAMWAYWKEVNALAQDRRMRGRWVLYHRSKRLAVSKRSADLFVVAKEQGLRVEEFFIGQIAFRTEPPWMPKNVFVTIIDNPIVSSVSPTRVN